MRMNGEMSRNAFLTNAAEELRGPVNGVLGMNDMILEGTKDKQLQEYASNVELAGKTLLGMVNNIADLAKMESGSMGLEESLKAYEQGSAMLTSLEKELAEATRRVTILRQDEAGNDVEEEVIPEEDA